MPSLEKNLQVVVAGEHSRRTPHVAIDGERCSQSLAEGMQVAVTDGERCSQSLAGTQPLKRKQRAAAWRRTRSPPALPCCAQVDEGVDEGRRSLADGVPSLHGSVGWRGRSWAAGRRLASALLRRQRQR